MGFPWNFHEIHGISNGISMGFHGISMAFPWDFHWISTGFPWDFMGFPWDFHGISMGFHGISMNCLFVLDSKVALFPHFRPHFSSLGSPYWAFWGKPPWATLCPLGYILGFEVFPNDASTGHFRTQVGVPSKIHFWKKCILLLGPSRDHF